MIISTEPITMDNRFWTNINALAKEAFPPEEYVAPEELVKMSATKGHEFLALVHGDSFIGYMVVYTYRDLLYPLLLAIDPSHRSKGYGSHAIEALKERYADRKLIVDFEMPDDAAPNKEQRLRRRQFYLRNGYRETGLFVSYMGIDYEVFSMSDDFDPQAYKDMLGEMDIIKHPLTYFTK